MTISTRSPAFFRSLAEHPNPPKLPLVAPVQVDGESLEDESLEEDAFIGDSGEEDTDVADILGGDIEKEEET
jgi:hypothetical protein